MERDKVALARALLSTAEERGVTIILPSDVVVAASPDDGDGARVETEVPEGMMALDIGPKTRQAFAERLRKARTVFWNGPMGVFEKQPFDEGTLAVCRAVAASVAFSVVGGGDSVAAVKRTGLADEFSHVSTGGGASLEFVQGRDLPGVVALMEETS